MRVHRALRAPGGARRIEPERHAVGSGVRGPPHGARRLRPRGKIDRTLRQRATRTRDDDPLHIVPALRHGLLQRGQQCAGHEQRLRAAVRQHVGVVVGGEQRVDGNGHDARVQRSEEGHRKIHGVVQAEQHTLVAAKPDLDVGLRRRSHARIQLAVALRPGIVDVRGFRGTRGVAVEKALREIEAFRRRRSLRDQLLPPITVRTLGACPLLNDGGRSGPSSFCLGITIESRRRPRPQANSDCAEFPFGGTLMHTICQWQAINCIPDVPK